MIQRDSVVAEGGHAIGHAWLRVQPRPLQIAGNVERDTDEQWCLVGEAQLSRFRDGQRRAKEIVEHGRGK